MFGRDFRDHLIGAQEHVLRCAIEHDLLGRMAAAGQHVELAAADLQRLAGNHAAIGARQRRHQPEIAEPPLQHHVGARAVEPVRAEKGTIGFVAEHVRVEPHAERIQIFALARVQLHIVHLGEIAAEPHVVGMPVRGQHGSQSLALERPLEQRLPEFARRRVVEPGVEQHIAVFVLDQIDVDVVELERQRQAQPEDARRRLDPFERFRRGEVGKEQRLGVHFDDSSR